MCCRQWISNTQFVGLCQHHLQDRHEGGRLAEVAAAHDVCVDVESVGVGAALDAAGHTVQTTDYSWRQLERRVCVSLITVSLHDRVCLYSVKYSPFALSACHRDTRASYEHRPASSWFAVRTKGKLAYFECWEIWRTCKQTCFGSSGNIYYE